MQLLTTEGVSGVGAAELYRLSKDDAVCCSLFDLIGTSLPSLSAIARGAFGMGRKGPVKLGKTRKP